MVASGTLSTRELAKADTQSNNSIATANRDSSLTDRIKFSVCLPIQVMRPIRERAYGIFQCVFYQISFTPNMWYEEIYVETNVRIFYRSFTLTLPPWEQTTMQKIITCSIRRAPWAHRNPRCRPISKAARYRLGRSSPEIDANEARYAGRKAWWQKIAQIPTLPATTYLWSDTENERHACRQIHKLSFHQPER